MANVIRLKRASGSDPAASDLVSGEPAVRTDTGELFFKKDDGSVAKVSGAGGGPDFKYLALRNAANNGAASYPNADFTLVTSGTTTALTPTAANTLLVSVNGVIQKPNTGTSTPSSGFALSGSTIKFGANISAAPDFILYQESGGIGEPSDDTVSEVKLKVSNSPVNGYFLSAQSGNTGGLTWAAPVATSCTGNSATATALATARAINGVNFDGTAAITVTAAAGTLTGTTLKSTVVTSSLTSLGDLGGLTVDGDATFTGANYNVLWDKSDNALEFADNAKARFGTGNDLEIFHDGTNTFMDNSTGIFLIRNTNAEIRIRPVGPFGGTNEESAIFKPNGAVELYHDNSKKFETTSSGIDVTGSNINIEGGSASLSQLKINSTGRYRGVQLDENGTRKAHFQHDATSNNLVVGTAEGTMQFNSGDTPRVVLNSSGHWVPYVDSTYDLGLNGTRWRNVYADTLYGDGSNLTGITAGAQGGGGESIFFESENEMNNSYTISTNHNALIAGPLTIASGATLTINSPSVVTIP